MKMSRGAGNSTRRAPAPGKTPARRGTRTTVLKEARDGASPRHEARMPARARREVPNIGLGQLLREADMVFNRALRDELARHNATFSQYQHLRQLWKDDGLAQNELSRRIGIETASSTTVLDQLDKRGLIRRQRDPKDRRRIVVRLTPAGRALEGPLDDCAIAVNGRARARLSQAQISALFDTVEIIIQNIRAGQTNGARAKNS